MKSRLLLCAVALACFAATGTALADCAADSTVQQTQQRYAKAQQLEAAGNLEAAFNSYVAAQDYTCDPNPVEGPAARRAAPLALQLGGAAEKSGNFEKAFDLYDRGGQYAAADRALMAWARANPDSPGVYGKAREVLEDRALGAFAANNKARLAVTGAYTPDPRNLTEVLAMPAKGFERALQKESTAFNEEYLRGVVQRIATRPEDPTDFAATQAWANAQQPFVQKWSKFPGGDPLKASRDSLGLARTWAHAAADQAEGDKLLAQRNQRIEQRVATLTKSYAGAPELLAAAIDYQGDFLTEDPTAKEKRMDTIRMQAGQLGDTANGKQRYALAADYYSVAGQDEKAQAARDAMQKLAMAKMQPQIDQAQQQAERIKQEYSDPAKVQAMKDQALAMQKRLQEQQKANAKTNAKKADDLESELGL